MVKRTYTTGISFRHIPKSERKSARFRLASIVDQLSNASMEFCATYIDDVVEYFIGNPDPKISDNIKMIDTDDGKFGVNAIMTYLNDKHRTEDGKSAKLASNHLHGATHFLSNSSKGHYNRIQKLITVFVWLEEHPEQMIQYLLWGRSVYLNHVFAGLWKTTFRWVDDFMMGVWNQFVSKHPLIDILPRIKKREFVSELDNLINEVSSQEETAGRKVFINRLKYLRKNFHKFNLDLASIPTCWNNLKDWVTEQQLAKYKTSAWAGVVRSVISRVYVSNKHFDTLINTIRTAHVSDLLNVPFKNKLKKLPYLMMSAPKYVIKREINKNSLKELKKTGEFSLTFKELGGKSLWKDALTLKVRSSRKIREVIKHRGVKLMSMIVLPPKGPARDVDIQLTFKGPIEAFTATKHLRLKHRLKVRKRDQMGIDVNRRGEYAVVSSLNPKIPEKINQVNLRWTKVLDEIYHLQSLVDKGKRVDKYTQTIELLFDRKIHLRHDYHIRHANFVGQQMVSASCRTLIIEGLQVSTHGKKGALAKAIESMPDDQSLYAREVLAVKLYRKKDCELAIENPYGSSRYHIGCGGILDRQVGQYDIAPCKLCKLMVNTHHNAALYIEAKYLGLKPREKSCLKPLQLKSPIGS